MQFEVHRRPDRPFFLACFFILVFSAIFSNSTLGFSMPRLMIKWRACSSKCDLESALLSHPLLQNAEPMMCIQEHNIMYYVVTSWPSWSHTQLYWCGWYTRIRMSTLYFLSSAEWDLALLYFCPAVRGDDDNVAGWSQGTTCAATTAPELGVGQRVKGESSETRTCLAYSPIFR